MNDYDKERKRYVAKSSNISLVRQGNLYGNNVTENVRILVLDAISIANEFIKQYRINKNKKNMTGAEVIALERKRQIEVEHYDKEHDSHLNDGGLEKAAIAYVYSSIGNKQKAMQEWPWLLPFLKPKSRVRDLARAGALIAAAIDKLEDECSSK